MTGISDLIAQKEQQDRDDERDTIVGWISVNWFFGIKIDDILKQLKSGEHRKANTNEG